MATVLWGDVHEYLGDLDEVAVAVNKAKKSKFLRVSSLEIWLSN